MSLIDPNLNYDLQLFNQGINLIAGIDEVGRGPLAGPVVAACVVLDQNTKLSGINDSKKLTKKKREELAIIIKEHAIEVTIGIIDHKTIDKVNILEATKLAMIESFNKLTTKVDYLLIDAVKLNLDVPNESLIKGDTRSTAIAAASIIAKVTRDKIMKDYDSIYPEYGFINNSGYPTKQHRDALLKYGITKIHRLTFRPVSNIRIKNPK